MTDEAALRNTIRMLGEQLTAADERVELAESAARNATNSLAAVSEVIGANHRRRITRALQREIATVRKETMTEFTDKDDRRYVLTNELRFVLRLAPHDLPGLKDQRRIPMRILQQKRVYAGQPFDAAGEWHDVPTAEE